MSLGFRDERRRRRRRVRRALLRGLLALGLIFAAGIYAYQTGARLAEKSVAGRDENPSEPKI